MKKIMSGLLSFIIFSQCFPVIALAQTAMSRKDFVIESGDILSIQVLPAEEFSREVTVQPDGTIELPMLGSFKVSGMRSEELEKVMTAKFSKYVANPSITITIRKFSTSRIAVIGESKAQGYFEYRDGMRLLDIVAQAGGLGDYPKADKIRIYRRTALGEGKFKEEILKADVDAVMAGQMDQNITLMAGDIVYIPRQRVYKGAKWISDNLVPWFSLFTMGLTLILVTNKK